MQLKPLFIALTLALAPTAQAASLSDMFRDAQAYDAQYASARAAYRAGQEKLPQGRAGLLPSVTLTGRLSRDNLSTTFPGGDASFTPFGGRLSASQPLYRGQNLARYTQSKYQVEIAEYQLRLAAQDLILRVAQAYFDVLQAQDNLVFIGAQKAAISEQLAAARRNFEVGTATITDTHEAQARFDLAMAQEIAEKNNLDIRLSALETLIGKPVEPLNVLTDEARPHLELADIESWAQLAETTNLQVRVQQLAKRIADEEINFNRAGHHPTVDAVASLDYDNNRSFGSSSTDSRVASVGLQASLPIFQGGLTNSQVREAVANRERARNDLENAIRLARLNARQTYFNVKNGIARVRALEQALISSKVQLASTELGLQVGVRTNLDVLDAQQQVRSSSRDLSAARYTYLLAELALKATADTLTPDDLAAIDKGLRPAKVAAN